MGLKKAYFRLISNGYLHQGGLYPVLESRYHSFKIIGCETVNQLLRLAGIPNSYRLTTVGIETSNTCNLKCVHCPTNREMKREKGYMEFSMFQHIIDMNPGIPRVYLTNWGEPLLHPHIVEMIQYAHSKGKHTAITTNGTILDEALSRELFKSGLDIIKFSVDGGKESHNKLRGGSYNKVKSDIMQFIRIRDELNASTWIEVSMLAYDKTYTEIKPFFQAWKNHADYVNLNPKFFSIKKQKYSSCLDLWRMLVVLWDGRVVPCCADYEGTLVIGDAVQKDLQSIFKSKEMGELRRMHLRKELPELCNKCSQYYSDYYISPKNLPVL